jgi:hypothetical protein
LEGLSFPQWQVRIIERHQLISSIPVTLNFFLVAAAFMFERLLTGHKGLIEMAEHEIGMLEHLL